MQFFPIPLWQHGVRVLVIHNFAQLDAGFLPYVFQDYSQLIPTGSVPIISHSQLSNPLHIMAKIKQWLSIRVNLARIKVNCCLMPFLMVLYNSIITFEVN